MQKAAVKSNNSESLAAIPTRTMSSGLFLNRHILIDFRGA
jgi:hypothetical protein